MQPSTLSLRFTRGDDYRHTLRFRGRPAGSDGLALLRGSGAPSVSLGDDGDYYVDTDNAVSYGPKTAGAWGSAIPLPTLDYSDMEFAAQIREFEDALTAWDFTFDDTDIADGDLILEFAAIDSAEINRVHSWDLERIDGAGKKKTILSGTVTVDPDTTRT